MMKFDQLVQFVEAAKHEHLGKAAKAVHISPGAISHSIAALEAEFGKKLFAKRGKHIYLTEHGKLLLEKGQKLLAEAAAIREALSSDQLELRGHFRLAGTHILASKFLMPAWAALQNDSDRLTGEVFTRRSSEVVLGVIKGEYDFGLCFSPQPHIDISSEVVYSGQIQIAVRKGHELSTAKPKEWLSRISEFPATMPKAFHGIDVCEQHPMLHKFKILQGNPSCLVDSYELAIEMIVASNSWSFIPDFLIGNEKRVKVLEPPLGWKAPYDVVAIWSRHGVMPRAMSQVLQRLKNKLAH